MQHQLGDVRDANRVWQAVKDCKPDFIFHLAVQSFVRLSYQDSAGTYATNVMGTAHLLDAVRVSNHPCSIVVITTDKCYENSELGHGYSEEYPWVGMISKDASGVKRASILPLMEIQDRANE